LATMTAANRCADCLSDRPFKTGIFAPFGLHALAYSEARGKFGLSSQAVVRAIAKVADAYQSGQEDEAHLPAHGGDRLRRTPPDMA